MTAREYSTHEHPQPDILSSGERRSTSTTSSKSPPPAVNMRSPSPRVAFTATAITTDSKGVKTITRKVIRRLEELGHPSELLQMDGDLVEEIDEQIEVERVLNEDRTGKVGTSSPNKSQQRRQSKQHLNGTATPRAMKTPPSSSQKDLANGKGLQKKEKVDWEIPRKLLHSSIGLLVSYLYLCDADLSLVTFTLWAALCVIVPADVLRLNYPPFARIYERMLGFLMRESEKHTTNGVIWYILGVNFVLSFYPRDVAAVSILILSWADTAASTIGRLYGSRTPRLPSHLLGLPLSPRKSLAGFMAAAITGFCIGIGFWGWLAPLADFGSPTTIIWNWETGARSINNLNWVSSQFQQLSGITNAPGRFSTGGWAGLLSIGLVAGIVSAVAEALDLGSVDDNLSLPIISGACLLGFFKFLGFFSLSS